MKVTNQQLFDLVNALRQLDGYEKTHLVNGQPTLIYHSFKIKDRLKVARILDTAERLFKPFTLAKEGIVRSANNGKNQIDPSHEKFGEVNDQVYRLLQEEVEVTWPGFLAEADLNLEENQKDGNPIPVTTLHGLLPVISQ